MTLKVGKGPPHHNSKNIVQEIIAYNTYTLVISKVKNTKAHIMEIF